MSIIEPSYTKIASPQYLQGRKDPLSPKRFAVALPKEIAADLSRNVGSLLTSAPGRVAVSSVSGLGWAAFGTIHRVLWITRMIFCGTHSEKTVRQVAESVDLLGQKELEAKEVLRDSLIGHIGTAASFIPGGSFIKGSTALVGGVDAVSKSTQRWGLFGLRALVTNLFGYTKYIVGGSWFGWGERKIEHLKLSCYKRMVHPSHLGDEVIRWSDAQHSAAYKLVQPPHCRPQISFCTDHDFKLFTEHSPEAKRIILEKVTSSTLWGLSKEEASAFKKVLERWIKNEKEVLPQTEEDKKVLKNLFSIFKALPQPKPLSSASKDEYDAFKRLPLNEQKERLFLLAYQQNDPNSIPIYLQSMKKEKEALTKTETDELLQLLGQYSSETPNLCDDLLTPADFALCQPYVQYRLFQMVGMESPLSPPERRLFVDKASSSFAWQNLSLDDKELLSHIALYHFNKLPNAQKECIFNITLAEVQKLPEENLSCFVLEILDKLPLPTVAEEIGLFFERIIDPDRAFEREKEIEVIKAVLRTGPRKIIKDPALLKSFIDVANKCIPYGKKIELRNNLDTPLAIYFFTESELSSLIKKYTHELDDLSLPEMDRALARKLLAIFTQAQEWHIVEEAESEEEMTAYALKEEESLPPRTAGVSTTPLERINKMIGSQIITSGAFYKGFDITGAALEQALLYTGLGVGQIPRSIGLFLDSTVGSTTVYGSLRALAVALQICARFPTLMNQLALSLTTTVGGKEYSWIENIERPVASISYLPLKLTLPLQNSLLGGIESLKARFEHWNKTLLTLKESQKKIEETGSVDQLQQPIDRANTIISFSTSALKKTALSSSDTTLQSIGTIEESELKEIFSSSHSLQQAALKLIGASVPAEASKLWSAPGSETKPQSRETLDLTSVPSVLTNPYMTPSGTRIDSRAPEPATPSFFSSLLKPRNTLQEKIKAPEGKLLNAMESNPIVNTLSDILLERTSQLATLYQDLQIARSAQQTIEKASSLQKFFATYGGENLSSFYDDSVAPALSYALTLWKKEIACATRVVQAIAKIESIETRAAYSLFSGINQAGAVAQTTTETAVQWISSHIGDMLLEQHNETEKSTARRKLDTALSYVAGIGSRSVVTLLLGSFFGYYSPVILLPFLLSRTAPDLLNAAAEPIARNLGKSVFLNTYHGVAWAGRKGGVCAHKGMTAIGQFVQSAINRRMGYVDAERVKTFLSLTKKDQEYVYEVIKESTQITEAMKKELEIIAHGYFSEASHLDERRRMAFIEALLMAYDHLQPQDFIKISPAYFSELDARIQQRIKKAVKAAHPNRPLAHIKEVISLFNELSPAQRKAINRITIEEFVSLSPEKQYEFCFQTLHSTAYKHWFNNQTYSEPLFEDLFSKIDPKNFAPTGKLLDTLFDLYQDVGDGDLADMTPESLSAGGISRLMRLHEFFETYHSELLSVVADATLENEEEAEDDDDSEKTIPLDSIPALLANEHPLDAETYDKRKRLVAGLASAYRTLPEASKKLFFDISPLEVSYMSREQKKLFLEFLIQKNPTKKEEFSSLITDVDLSEKAHLDTFLTYFNALDQEDKAFIHQTSSLQSSSQHNTFSFLTRSLVEELKAVDIRLQRSSMEEKEAGQKINELTALLDALKSTGGDAHGRKRIEVIIHELRKASVLKTLREQEIGYLLTMRGEIEKMLVEEHLSVPPCPIQQKPKTNPITKEVCDLMLAAMHNRLASTATLDDLEKAYRAVLNDLESMKMKLQEADHDTEAKELAPLVATQIDALESVYNTRKCTLMGKRVELPEHLSHILRGTKERFSQIKEVATLQQSYSEALSFIKQLATYDARISHTTVDIVCQEINAAFTTRNQQLTTSSWNKVRALLRFNPGCYLSSL